METAAKPHFQIDVASHQYLIKSLVKSILEHPWSFDWQIQGLGMLRTYIAPELRLHVWAPEAEFEDVSKMHTHPWNFTSYVIAGCVRNKRYTLAGAAHPELRPYMQQEILCGVGGGPSGEPESVLLNPWPEEAYREGQSYRQRYDEIHSSAPEPGTVTLIHREFQEDADHAYVYYPAGTEWVTAEPRGADKSEVDQICHRALTTWFR